MGLTRYTISRASVLTRRDVAVAPKACRFDVTLHDDEGPAFDLKGFLINREGKVATPTSYMARSTKTLKLIGVRDDILAGFGRDWESNPVLAAKLAQLGSFYDITRREDEDEVFEVGL